MADDKQLWIVSHIKKVTRGGQEKTYFDRVGSGFATKKGDGFTFRLEQLPTGLTPESTFHFAPYKPKEQNGNESFSE
jgi:hypothetical protein